MKKQALNLFVGATLCSLFFAPCSSTAQVPSYVPTNGLVGWWPFNGNANDESGNGNNGTVNGATLTTDRFGVVNKAYSFDGINDFIDVQNNPSLQITNSITLSGWVRPDTVFTTPQTWGGRIIDKCTVGSTDGFLFDLGANTSGIPGGLEKRARFIGVDNNVFSTQFYTVSDIWYYLSVTFDGSEVQFFVNGSLDTIVPLQGVLQTNNIPLRFGGHNQQDNSWFYGKIDDIGIWNRTLTECEIADLYNAQLGSFANTQIIVNPALNSIGTNSMLIVSSPVQDLQWQSNPSNIGWINLSENTYYSGVNNDTLTVFNLQLSNHNQPYRVMACGDISNVAFIQISDTCITNTTIYDTLYTTVTDTLIINTTLGLAPPNDENTILIYPNPTNDFITIDNGNYSAMPGYSIVIENNAGQQVFQNVIDQPQFYIDLSTWTGNGLYFVHLIDPQGNTVDIRKIVLQ